MPHAYIRKAKTKNKTKQKICLHHMLMKMNSNWNSLAVLVEMQNGTTKLENTSEAAALTWKFQLEKLVGNVIGNFSWKKYFTHSPIPPSKELSDLENEGQRGTVYILLLLLSWCYHKHHPYYQLQCGHFSLSIAFPMAQLLYVYILTAKTIQ